jgi:uncharacterized membrane protein
MEPQDREELFKRAAKDLARARSQNQFRKTGATIFGCLFAVVFFVALSSGKVGAALLFGGLSAFLFYSAYQHGK